MALQAWDKQANSLRTEIESLKLKNEWLIQQLMIGEKRPDSPTREPGGPPWPGYPNPMPPGKDWPPGKLAHGEHFNRYGEIIGDPTKGFADPSGNPITIPHLEQSPQEKKENERIHNQNYPHPSHDLQVSSRQDKLIRGIMSQYGKQGGQYQDEDKLLKNLLMIGELNRKV